MELRGVSLKRVRTYFCESPILGEWVKQPLFPIIGSRCSQKWLLISLLRVFEHAYRKSFLPSPTLSEAKSRFILDFRSVWEAKTRFIFGFLSVRKAKSRFILGFLSVRRAKSQFIFRFTESPESKIAIHFGLHGHSEHAHRRSLYASLIISSLRIIFVSSINETRELSKVSHLGYPTQMVARLSYSF